MGDLFTDDNGQPPNKSELKTARLVEGAIPPAVFASEAADTTRMVDDHLRPILLEETGPGEERHTFIGGSDVAAILGMSKWATPLTVWEKKTGRYVEPPDPATIKRWQRGKRWEQPAFEMLLEVLRDRGHEIIEHAANRRYRDGEHSFFACEIDREIILDGEFCNVEIKTVHPFAAKDWGEFEDEDGQLTDRVPNYYGTQAMWGLGITGIGRCVVGCLIGADVMQPYFVDRDDETIAEMRATCLKFWNHNIIGDHAPDPIDMADIARMLYKINGRPAELDDRAYQALKDLQRNRKEIKALEEIQEQLKFIICDSVRRVWGLEEVKPTHDDAELRRNGVKVGTWDRTTKHTVDSKLLEMKYPKIREEVDHESVFRVIRAQKHLN